MLFVFVCVMCVVFTHVYFSVNGFLHAWKQEYVRFLLYCSLSHSLERMSLIKPSEGYLVKEPKGLILLSLLCFPPNSCQCWSYSHMHDIAQVFTWVLGIRGKKSFCLHIKVLLNIDPSPQHCLVFKL